MRQAGTWDPLLKCCNACTWTHVSSSNEIPRNCMGLKITACMHLEGKFWRKDAKRPQTLPLLKLWIKRRLSRAEAGYCTCPLPTWPPKRWTKPLRHPLAWALDTLYPHTMWETHWAPPSQRVSKQGNLLFVLAPPSAAGALINPSFKKKESVFFFNAKVLCHFLFNLARFTYIHIMEHCIPLYSLLKEFPTGLSLLWGTFPDRPKDWTCISCVSCTLRRILYQWNITQLLNEWNNAICNKMDGPRDYHTKWYEVSDLK